MKNKLKNNTIYLYILTFVKLVFPLIILPFLTRVLSIETFGVVTYVKTYASYVQLVIDFGFMLSTTKAISLISGKKNEKINYIIGNTIVEKFILAFVMGLLTFILTLKIPILKANSKFTWLYYFAICMNIFVADYFFRGIERMGYIAIPYTIAKIVFLVCTVVFVKNDNNYILIPIFEMIGNFIASSISLFLIRSLGFKIKVDGLKVWLQDLKESSVYFISNFSTTIFGSFTTIIAGIYLSLIEVSIWGIAMQVVSIAKAMYTPITNSIYPYMVKKKDIRLVYKICIIMIFPMIFGIILILIFGSQILVMIAGDDYYGAGIVLKYLLPAIVVSFYSMIFGWPVLGVINKVIQTTWSTLIAGGVQLLLILIIITTNCFSLLSLSVSVVIAEITLLLIRIVIYWQNRRLFSF